MLHHANWIVTLILIMIYVMMCRSNLTRTISIKSTGHNYIHQYHIILRMNELGRGPTKIITFIKVDRNRPLTYEGDWYSFILEHIYQIDIMIAHVTIILSTSLLLPSGDQTCQWTIHHWVPYMSRYKPMALMRDSPASHSGWHNGGCLSEWYRTSWCFSTSKNLGISGE